MVRGITSELSAEIGSEEPSAFTNHIVEDEESIGERQEFDFSFTQRINLMICSDELDKSWLCQCVCGIGKLSLVTCAR